MSQLAPSVASATPPYTLPDELLIDTTIARRIIGEFLRGHLRQTGLRATRARASPAGSIRRWLRT